MPYDFTTWDRNCKVEQATPIQGSTSGSPPPWLRGAYIINGPGRMSYGDSEFLHVFDGSAILQKYNLGETGVTYSSRFLRSYAFMTNSESEQIVVSEFGTKGSSVAKSKLAKLGDKFAFDKMFSDNAPVSLVKYGEDYYATTESPFVHKIDPSTLETISKVDLHKELSINSVCPHPVLQPDGTAFGIVHSVGATGPKYDVVSFPAKPLEGKSTVFAKPHKIGSVEARWKFNPCHMHTFGVTPNYVILLEQPLTIDVKAMVANTIREKPFIGGMEWMENKLVKIHLVDRSSGKELKTKVKCEPFFYLHIINTYETNNQVVIDICGYDKPSLLHALFVEKIRTKGPSLADEIEGGSVKRIVVPLNITKESAPDTNLVTLSGSKATAHRQKDGVVLLKPETICSTVYENPTINPSKCGQPYRYYWGAEGAFKENCGKVGKVDMESGNVITWQEENFFSAEAHFVPRPGATAEDDGVVLVPGLFGGPRRNETMLVILNAADMTEISRSTFSLASDASRALHGIFIPA